MRSKLVILTLVFMTAAFGLSGCSLLKKRVEKTEKVEYTLSSSGKTSFSIENVSGSINIRNTGDTLGFITVNAVKTAEVRHDEQDKPIDNIEIIIDSSGNEIRIETEIRNNSGLFKRSKGAEVDYDVKVPANMNVKVENTNGRIIITGLKNDVTAETVNGSVNVYGSRGKLDITSVNGKVICNVDSVTKSINVDVVNGSVKIGGLKNADAEVDASTVNGKVKFKDLTFTNVNYEKRSLTGILGKGGNNIHITTVNGSVTFEANKISAKNDDSFEFRFDFDDDDEEQLKRKIEEELGDDKGIEFEKSTDTNKQPELPGNADSLRKK